MATLLDDELRVRGGFGGGREFGGGNRRRRRGLRTATVVGCRDRTIPCWREYLAEQSRSTARPSALVLAVERRKGSANARDSLQKVWLTSYRLCISTSPFCAPRYTCTHTPSAHSSSSSSSSPSSSSRLLFFFLTSTSNPLTASFHTVKSSFNISLAFPSAASRQTSCC